MTDQSNETGRPAQRGWTARLMVLAPTRTQAAVGVIGALALSNAALWIELQRRVDQPIVTVSVRELTQGYIAKLATANISPEEASIRADAFLAVSQDTLKNLALKHGVVVVARECVLAGEKQDITVEVGARVDAALMKLGGFPKGVDLAASTPAPVGGLAQIRAVAPGAKRVAP